MVYNDIADAPKRAICGQNRAVIPNKGEGIPTVTRFLREKQELDSHWLWRYHQMARFRLTFNTIFMNKLVRYTWKWKCEMRNLAKIDEIYRNVPRNWGSLCGKSDKTDLVICRWCSNYFLMTFLPFDIRWVTQPWFVNTSVTNCKQLKTRYLLGKQVMLQLSYERSFATNKV